MESSNFNKFEENRERDSMALYRQPIEIGNELFVKKMDQMKDGIRSTNLRNKNVFKNNLPIARIKKIMKTNNEVKMVSSETLFLFSKACELFVLELAYKSWAYANNNKRRTLQKYDIKSAITKTKNYDFLLDAIDDKFKNSLKQFFEKNDGKIIDTDFIENMNNQDENSTEVNILQSYMNHYKNFFGEDKN